MTSVVFGTCTVTSLLSIGLVLAFGHWSFAVLVLSVGYNIWALIISERHGFVRSSQLRRAYEPERHFNAAQVLTVVVYVMAQFGVGAYALLTA